MTPAPDTRCLTLLGFQLAVWRDHGTWRGEDVRPVEDRRVRGEELAYLRMVLRERE